MPDDDHSRTRVFTGGPILTMQPDPVRVEAVAVTGGTIAAAGPKADVLEAAGPAAEVVDLAGRTLMPSFVDGHGHIAMVATSLGEAQLAAPPIGTVESIPQLIEALRDFIAARDISSGDWVVGRGYDPAFLKEGRHPTRHELDRASSEHPIYVRHVSGHLGAANTAALRRAGVTAETPDPPGGVIRREEDGQPDGVLEEAAIGLFGANTIPSSDADAQRRQLAAAQRLYLENGITTAQEGVLLPPSQALLETAAARGELGLDVVAYPFWQAVESLFEGRTPGSYSKRLKYGGMKLMLDGSPQGKTAWLTKPYHEVPEGQAHDYRGYPAMSDERALALTRLAFDRGWQVICHCNGDAAADQFLSVLRTAGARAGDGRRPVMIHAQTVRDDQLDVMVELGVLPSFFVSHVYYWGDYHRDSVLGPERAARISPLASAEDRGIRFNLHNDSPVAPPDIFRLVSSAVTRRTRSGALLGGEQRISVDRALRAVTIDSAYAHFEEDRKGAIEPGKLADLIVLDRDPTAIDAEELADVRVLETIKEGRSLYRRP